MVPKFVSYDYLGRRFCFALAAQPRLLPAGRGPCAISFRHLIKSSPTHILPPPAQTHVPCCRNDDPPLRILEEPLSDLSETRTQPLMYQLRQTGSSIRVLCNVWPRSRTRRCQNLGNDGVSRSDARSGQVPGMYDQTARGTETGGAGVESTDRA